MNKRICLICTITTLLLFVIIGSAGATGLTQKEKLGERIFDDTKLSTPPGEGCITCHDPNLAFADSRDLCGGVACLAVSQGANKSRFGLRRSPRIGYDFSPDFHFNDSSGKFEGGQFRDGRAQNLTEQEKLPFLNQLEINDPDRATVIYKIRNDTMIAPLFKVVFGKTSLDDVDTAYNYMADALAAYVKSKDLIKFTSKFDLYLAGKVNLSDQETRGFKLFNDVNNTCSTCHITKPGPFFPGKPLFTDFTYGNPGGPNNSGMIGDGDALRKYFPYYYETEFNPDGLNFIDLGLGGALEKAGYPPNGTQGYTNQLGKFKVPSLRNVALTAPYFHNGALRTLKQVVHFYNTRDVLVDCAKKLDPQPSVNCWPQPEYGATKNPLIGHLGLNDSQENDIVAFLNTLTDGYSAKEVN